jgi:uncharacterized membrane protein
VTILIFWIAIALLVGALQYSMPQLSRRDIFFSVTVAPEFRSTLQAHVILAGYRRGIVIVTTLALALIVVATQLRTPLAGAGVLMLELFVDAPIFIVAHRKTEAFASAASSVREASLQARVTMPGLTPLLLGPYLMLACAVLVTRAYWSEIPDPMPVHWDLAGNPNGWMPKTWQLYAGLTAGEFVLCLMLTFAIVGMLYFSRQIAASGARAREESRFRWIGVAALLAGSYLSAALGFLPLSPRATFSFGGVTFLLAVMIVGSIELMRRGQGGARIAPAAAEPIISDRTPDACWKWGAIYYNPDDPALIVEKRFGIGWTLNFAHRGAWIFMGLALVSVALSLSLPLLARLR